MTRWAIGYRVLDANHDPHAASVLQTAHQLLMDYADHITDETLRRSFLENVATHRELQAAYAHHADSAGAIAA